MDGCIFMGVWPQWAMGLIQVRDCSALFSGLRYDPKSAQKRQRHPRPGTNRRMERLDAVFIPHVPLLQSRRHLQRHSRDDYLLRVDDGFREFFLLLHQAGLFGGAAFANDVAAQLPRGVPVLDVREHVHLVLHLPAPHVFLLHGVRSHVREAGREPLAVGHSRQAGAACSGGVLGVGCGGLARVRRALFVVDERHQVRPHCGSFIEFQPCSIVTSCAHTLKTSRSRLNLIRNHHVYYLHPYCAPFRFLFQDYRGYPRREMGVVLPELAGPLVHLPGDGVRAQLPRRQTVDAGGGVLAAAAHVGGERGCGRADCRDVVVVVHLGVLAGET